MIVFNSLSHKDILKNRNTVFQQTKILLKDLYKTIKNDLIINNYILDVSQYQDEIRHTLIIMYRKLYSKNIKMTSNISKKNIKANNKITMDSKQKAKVDKDVFNQIQNLIEQQSEIRSKLLINSIDKSIEKIKDATQNEFNDIISRINEEINSISSELIQFPNFIESDRLNVLYNQLKDKRDKIIKDRDELIREKQDNVNAMFVREFDEQVVKNKSEIHTENEIDNFDTLQQREESNAIDKFFQFALFIDEDENRYKQSESTKTWINMLDKDSRGWHAREHGTTINENEYFELIDNSGNIERCLCPRDRNLSAYNSIGCRCILERKKEFLSVVM